MEHADPCLVQVGFLMPTLATDPARHHGPTGAVMGRHDDDCAQRWVCEQQRLVMFRRQRARTRDDLRAATDERIRDQLRIERDALDVSIGYTVELMCGIEDEHNGHTVGTWEHSQRGPHVPVKEPA